VTGWRKSPFSGNGGCVDVLIGQVDVLVRDTKDRTGPFLVFTHDEWRTFIAAAKAGEFDLPGSAA